MCAPVKSYKPKDRWGKPKNRRIRNRTWPCRTDGLGLDSQGNTDFP